MKFFEDQYGKWYSCTELQKKLSEYKNIKQGESMVIPRLELERKK